MARKASQMVLVATLLLTAIATSTCADLDEPPLEDHVEFANPLRLGPNRRLHLVSEIVASGHQVQVEEFVDLSTYNQRIQFKWHELSKKSPLALGSQESREVWRQNFATRKLDLLVLNDEQDPLKRVVYQYEPFKCKSQPATTSNEDDWRRFIDRASQADGPDEPVRHLIESIHSFAPNSPYLAHVASERLGGSVIIVGVAGLWLRASQSALVRPHDWAEEPPATTPSAGERTARQTSGWRLSLGDAQPSVDYFPETSLFNGRKTHQKPPGTSELLSYAEIRDQRQASGAPFHTVNLIDVDFDYSEQMARDVHTLPVGFGCPENKQLARDGLYFRENNPNGLLELELVASRLASPQRQPADWPIELETDVRHVRIAQSRHPLDAGKLLFAIHSLEDQSKLILDYHANLRHLIRSSAARKQRCLVEHMPVLHETADGQQPADDEYEDDDYWDENFNEQDDLAVVERQGSSASGARAAAGSNAASGGPPILPPLDDSLEVAFDNGLTLELSPQVIEYILGLDAAEQKAARLLNRLETADGKYEFVFEAEVPRARRQMVRLRNRWGNFVAEQMSIVRVYEQLAVGGSVGLPVKRPRKRGFISLARAQLLVFDEKRQLKLAEFQLNLAEQIQQMSLARRARLFDLSLCYANPADESLELEVAYPADARLLDYSRRQGHELLDSFYANYYKLAQNSTQESGRELAPELAASLNFLRVPRVELLAEESAFGAELGDPVAAGELVLRLTLLDRLSPLVRFRRLDESSFATAEPLDERLASLASPASCAALCARHECKMFAYNGRTLECKVTQLAAPTLIAESASQRAVHLVLEPASVVYYDPEANAARDETGLAAVGVLLNELAQLEPARRREQTGAERNRSKRELARDALFGLDIVDRFSAASEFAPPVARRLAPSRVRVQRSPGYDTFDVGSPGRDFVELERVASSFVTRQAGKCYKLTALDSGPAATAASAPRAEHKRTFIDRANKNYYTLRRLNELELAQCQLICSNMDEFRRTEQSPSEQLCVGLSFETLASECHLLIRTSFNHVRSILELAAEGDRVHELSSPDQLTQDKPDCVLQARNHLPEFLGPVALAPGFFGERTTSDDDGRPFGSSELQIEWLAALATESSQPDAISREACASQCVSRARVRQDPAAAHCLAFDFCSSTAADEKTRLRRFKLSCNLLLVKPAPGAASPSGAAQSASLARLRNHLLAKVAPIQGADGAEQRAPPGAAPECTRFVASHLREFNYLARGRIEPETLEQCLSKPDEAEWRARTDCTLDACALECYLAGAPGCLGFQFCMSLRGLEREQSATETQPRSSVERRCELFGGPRMRLERPANATQEEPGQPGGAGEATLVADDNCHVYARVPYKSLDEILNSELIPTADFEHLWLALGFSVAYAAALVCVVAYLVARFRARLSHRGG